MNNVPKSLPAGDLSSNETLKFWVLVFCPDGFSKNYFEIVESYNILYDSLSSFSQGSDVIIRHGNLTIPAKVVAVSDNVDLSKNAEFRNSKKPKAYLRRLERRAPFLIENYRMKYLQHMTEIHPLAELDTRNSRTFQRLRMVISRIIQRMNEGSCPDCGFEKNDTKQINDSNQNILRSMEKPSSWKPDDERPSTSRGVQTVDTATYSTSRGVQTVDTATYSNSRGEQSTEAVKPCTSSVGQASDAARPSTSSGYQTFGAARPFTSRGAQDFDPATPSTSRGEQAFDAVKPYAPHGGQVFHTVTPSTSCGGQDFNAATPSTSRGGEAFDADLRWSTSKNRLSEEEDSTSESTPPSTNDPLHITDSRDESEKETEVQDTNFLEMDDNSQDYQPASQTSPLDLTKKINKITSNRGSHSSEDSGFQSNGVPSSESPSTSCRKMIPIGKNGTLIPEDLENTLSGRYGMAIRKIMYHLFSRDELATHSLTGKPSPAFKDMGKAIKKRLNPNIVEDVIEFICKKFEVQPLLVKRAITSICADNSKTKGDSTLKRKHSSD